MPLLLVCINMCAYNAIDTCMILIKIKKNGFRRKSVDILKPFARCSILEM